MSGRREDLVATGLRAAWRAARALPEPAALALAHAAADVAHRRRGARVEQLRATLRRARPAAAPAELDALVREGLRAYARYWSDVFRLPSWSRERIVRTVRLEDAGGLRRVLADGGGAVCALGHLGNWDHAGAWGALQLGPVTTVAERLRPEAVFEEFVAFRRRLGVHVLPLGDPSTTGGLVRAARGGHVVPLLADRDLSATGVPVTFLGERVRMAAGPAVVALAAGVPLFPVVVRTEPLARGSAARRTGARYGVVVEVAPAVAAPPAPPGAPGAQRRRAAVAAMTQACADVLADGVRRSPHDWHVLQPVFTADVTAGPPAGSAGERA
ncbi:phosphatidylinositol mannoside acyltransferase [Kineococcus sp. SYSU DK004]|uniref:phosphatidylinositol mannoside acyltransferase n=1 Tax=Kineococcus sp. SYSU DK004 TaxID=3383125 RepID=UPI003D7DD3B6